MKTYKITIKFDDAVKAENPDEAFDKACWEVLPRMDDLSECIKVVECDQKDYEYYTREY